MRENAELSLGLETALGDCRRQIETTKEKTLLKVVPAFQMSRDRLNLVSFTPSTFPCLPFHAYLSQSTFPCLSFPSLSNLTLARRLG